MAKYQPTPLFISFLQATGLVVYCGLVGSLMLNGNRLFGNNPTTFLGPALFLLLFIVSAVVCSLIFLSYPFLLFWEHKQTKLALKVVALSTLWLAFYIISFLLLLILR